ncbi:MAG: carbohydrate-binding protein [Fibrobacteria bacterium]|nr:carbohydrate-binding protein [Fibrobacteria bacterium]
MKRTNWMWMMTVLAVAGPMSWGGLFEPLDKAKTKPKDALKGVFAEEWVDLDESSDAPTKDQMKLTDEIAGSFFIDGIPSGGFPYVYGGKTAQKTLASSTKGNDAVWAAYIDNDWSGVTVSLGTNKYMDLSAVRRTGTLTFWIKPGPNAKKFMVGLLDNQGGDKKVQTKVMGDGYATLKEGQWSQVRIPLKAFIDDGVYWDAAQSREISSKVDWSKIQEFRLSIGRDENKPGKGKPVAFYLDQIQVTRTANGVYDPEAMWDAFQSNAPDAVLTDFTTWADRWKTQQGNSAEIKAQVVDLPKGAPAGLSGKALKVDFKPGDWYDAFLRTQMAPGLEKDWRHHYGLSFWLYTEKPFQALDFVVHDAGHEMYLAKVGAGRGWNRVLVPFRNLSKFPYYQPPEADQNNRLDLEDVYQLGIKPGGDVPGTLYIGKLELTNLREIVREKGPAELPAVFQGQMAKVVQKVPDIYGVNVGLWAPELIAPAARQLQKDLHLGVVRYPGGLRSDEEDWEKTLRDKDFHVDTDEFLDWCQDIGCRPMFTANIGDGSPERAAAWVKYVNKTRKGPKVLDWELGNEIYGNWHKYYDKWGKDGGFAYARAVKEYVKAMKAVDPEIRITAVWMLGGPWNKTVFKEVADVVDGVNVHHYAQNAGSENDQGLLATSSESDKLMIDVRHQLDEYGVKGRKYELWLTEWNSVDFNPGAQILSHVNALFVADYLGHLAQAPLQKATLWALYNGRDKRMGDYGVLSTSADPQGMDVRRPTYWAMRQMATTLTGSLLEAKTDQEDLSGWMSRRDDGKISMVFVNKSPETDFKTTLKVPGLKGNAVVEILTAENSGGLKGSEPTGETWPSTGPVPERRKLADGATLVVPKYSVVTIRFE